MSVMLPRDAPIVSVSVFGSTGLFHGIGIGRGNKIGIGIGICVKYRVSVSAYLNFTDTLPIPILSNFV